VTAIVAAAIVGLALGILAVWRALQGISVRLTENGPAIVPNDLEAAIARIARRSLDCENRLISLENRDAEREAHLADALQRYERMTKRLTMRADRQRATQDETETGDLAAVIARRNGIR